MYKTSSKLQQASRERILLRHAPSGDVVLTPEQRRQNLVSIVKQLNAELLDGPTKDRRREIGIRLHELNQEIHSIRPKPRTPGIDAAFVNAAREILTPLQFGRILREAVKASGYEPVGEPQ